VLVVLVEARMLSTVTHSGWLQKKGESSISFLRSWNRTWVMLEGDILKLYTGPADVKSIAPKSEYSLTNAKLTVKDNPKHEHYFEIQLAGKADGQYLRFSAPSQLALLEWLSRLERGRDKKIITGLVINRGPLSDPDIAGSFSPVPVFSPPVFSKRTNEQIDSVPKMSSISDVALGLAKAIKKDTKDNLESKIVASSEPVISTSNEISSAPLKITSLAGAAIGLAKAVKNEVKENAVRHISETQNEDKQRRFNDLDERDAEMEFETPLTPLQNNTDSSSPSIYEKKEQRSMGIYTSSFSPENLSSSVAVPSSSSQQTLQNSLGLSPLPGSFENDKFREQLVSPNSRLESSGLSASFLNTTLMQSPPISLKMTTISNLENSKQGDMQQDQGLSTILENSASPTRADTNTLLESVSLTVSPELDYSHRYANRPASPEAELVTSDLQKQERFQHDIKQSNHVEDKHVALYKADEIMSGLLYLLETRDGRLGHLLERWVPRFALLETATFDGQDRPDGTGSGPILRLYTQTGPTELQESEMIQIVNSKTESIPRRPKSPRTTSNFLLYKENSSETLVLASPLSGDHSREEWIEKLNNPPAPATRILLPEKLLLVNSSTLTRIGTTTTTTTTTTTPTIELKKHEMPPNEMLVSLPETRSKIEVVESLPAPPPPPPTNTTSTTTNTIKVTKLAPSLPSHPLFAAAAASVLSTPVAKTETSVMVNAPLPVPVATSISPQLVSVFIPPLASTQAIIPDTLPSSSSSSSSSSSTASSSTTTITSSLSIRKVSEQRELPPVVLPHVSLSPSSSSELANSVLQFSGLDFDDLDDLDDTDTDNKNSIPSVIHDQKPIKQQEVEEAVEDVTPKSIMVSPIQPLQVKNDQIIESQLANNVSRTPVTIEQNQSLFEGKVFSPLQQEQQERSSFDMDMMYPISPPSILATTNDEITPNKNDKNDVEVMTVEEIETVEAIMLIDDSRLESPTPDFPISPTLELEFVRPKQTTSVAHSPKTFTGVFVPASPGSQSFYSAGGQLGEEDDYDVDNADIKPTRSPKALKKTHISPSSTLLKPTAASSSRAAEIKKTHDLHQYSSPSKNSQQRSISPAARMSPNVSIRQLSHKSSISPTPFSTERLVITAFQSSSTSPVSSPPQSARRRLIQRGQGSPIPELSAKRYVEETLPAPTALSFFDPFSVEFPEELYRPQSSAISSSLSANGEEINEVKVGQNSAAKSDAAARHAAAEAALAELFGKPLITQFKKSTIEEYKTNDSGHDFPRFDTLKKLDVDTISQRISRIGANLELESKQQIDESVINSTLSSSARSYDIGLVNSAGTSIKQKSILKNNTDASSVTRGRRIQRRGGIKVNTSTSRSPSKVYQTPVVTDSVHSYDRQRSRGRSISSIPTAGATREARSAADSILRSSSSSSSNNQRQLQEGLFEQYLIPTVLLGGVSGYEKYTGGQSITRSQRAISIERARAKIRGTVLVQKGKGASDLLRPEWKGGRW
jgi:hypothetical protein